LRCDENVVRDVAFRRPIVQEGGRSRLQVLQRWIRRLPSSFLFRQQQSSHVGWNEVDRRCRRDTVLSGIGWCSAMKDILHQWTQLVVMLSVTRWQQWDIG